MTVTDFLVLVLVLWYLVPNTYVRILVDWTHLITGTFFSNLLIADLRKACEGVHQQPQTRQINENMLILWFTMWDKLDIIKKITTNLCRELVVDLATVSDLGCRFVSTKNKEEMELQVQPDFVLQPSKSWSYTYTCASPNIHLFRQAIVGLS